MKSWKPQHGSCEYWRFQEILEILPNALGILSVLEVLRILEILGDPTGILWVLYQQPWSTTLVHCIDTVSGSRPPTDINVSACLPPIDKNIRGNFPPNDMNVKGNLHTDINIRESLFNLYQCECILNTLIPMEVGVFIQQTVAGKKLALSMACRNVSQGTLQM